MLLLLEKGVGVVGGVVVFWVWFVGVVICVRSVGVVIWVGFAVGGFRVVIVAVI